ncbi:MAG: heme-binding protein [Pseudomonadales bacterium]|nr:heme-binding protein [Pseudomonadales bacterium]
MAHTALIAAPTLGTTALKHSICLIAFITLSINNAMAIEEAKYTTLIKQNKLEVRLYEPHILAETLVDAAFDSAGNKAFRRLFKYIDGNNTVQQKIAMTAPVSQQADSQKISMTVPVSQQANSGKWAVSFMMPASYAMTTIPTPKDPSITIKQVTAQYMAAIEYSGFWTHNNYQQHKNKLDEWIKQQAFTVIGEPVWARYNPPITPWFLRRNEVLIPIAKPVMVK